MIIYLLWGYLAASISAFLLCYAACVAAAAADQRQAHRQRRLIDKLMLSHSPR